MTDEIRARIIEIETELFAAANYTRATVLAVNAAERNREFEERRVALSQERAALLEKLPPTGMASGQRLVIAQCLGEIRLEDWQTETAEVAGPIDEWDWED